MMIITVMMQLAGFFYMGSACEGQLDAVGCVPVLSAAGSASAWDGV